MLYLPAEFPQEPDLCYLNHAAIGPWPRRTAQAVAGFAQHSMLRGGTDYPLWLAVERRLRDRLARLVNAPAADDIALVKNTSEGLSIVAEGIDWCDGDEVVGLAGDFCSNQMPWQALARKGVRYRAVDALTGRDPDGELIAAISPKTRLLAISTVHFTTGYAFDMPRLAEACRAAGVLLAVDAIQSLGAAPFDLDQVPADIVTAGGHKWLLAPEGLGFLYCHADLREQLSLHQFGWAMREQPYEFEGDDWEPAHSARRFEAGTPNMTGIHALDASLSLFEEVGMAFVEERLADNIEQLETGLRALADVEILTPRDPRRRAGILTFRCAGIAGPELHRALMERRVICSARAGGIRLAPHFYTPQSVLEATLGHIRQAIQRNTKQ